VEYANDRGVPVITVDNTLEKAGGARVLSYVGADHFRMGAQAAELLVEVLEEKFPDEESWQVIELAGSPGASGTVDRELEAGIDDLLEAVEGKRVYLSIDKDVLGREWSRTDWSQGTYAPAQLKGWLDGLLKQELVAVDVCGELSPEKGATPEDLRVNCELNVELQEFILSYLKR
jgi:ABC-type xylose transport system substrate-binding protein